ncbi:pyrrolo-quinoline quinone beta-propeller repeat protein [Halosimplex carlsbadense 2-9-1]|uniref:Pyrrolo-quinoline quinone beta-propeller repeat protein n=1 Tax=Halosimplex carlsbadense 2-9-1 TaxID=797114 RepID=M0CK16_9EURY|nr:PQQ-binding-like beta-propeller repeat protein [Halosimplex carlsbadense]ELZ23566.1 pyrrolo-quinoline quinone beta-propeller repeat protein [Halosimplex carlsbadense 2-9-1]
MDAPLRRRSLLRALGAAGAATVAGCPAGIGESAGFEPGETDWPSARFGPRNTAVHPSAPGPGGDLSVAWTASFREGSDASAGVSAISSPIALDGTVFAAADISDDSGWQTVVSAFDLTTGDRQWERSLPMSDADGEGETSPARTLGSDGERLVVGTLSEGPGLAALSPVDGETEWEASLETPFESPVTAEGGSVVVGDRLLATYDASDGRRASRYAPGEDPLWRNRFPPTVTEDTIFATDRAAIHAVDRERGERRWMASNDFYTILYGERGAPFNSPVVVDGVAYAVCGRIANRDTGGMVALDVEDGSELWTAIPEGDDPATYEGDPEAFEQAAFYGMGLVLDDTVYVQGMERGEWGWFAVDAADGSVERMDTDGGLVAADGLVYGVTAEDGGLRATSVDPSADETLGAATVDEWEDPWVGPQAVAGEYYVVTTNQGIAAFGPN